MKKIGCLILPTIVVVLLFMNHYSWSYSRRIGNTQFYLVETMANSKSGKPLAGLYYKPTAESGYNGEWTPGFPLYVLWNDKYIISKNFDGDNPTIIKYIIINMDSINPKTEVITDIHEFDTKDEYYNYLNQINLSESDMKQTNNVLSIWDALF